MENSKKNSQQILIVDDEAVVRNGISRALNSKGMVTQLAANGQEALDYLRIQPFDLVLLDIRMPDMDGITLLKQIHAQYPETDVIMITGYPSIDSAVHCTKLGALDYLVKPFSLDDLEAALQKTNLSLSPSQEFSTDSNGLEIDSRHFEEWISRLARKKL